MNSIRKYYWEMGLGAIAAAMVGWLCIRFDFEISDAARNIKLPGDLKKGIQLSESFGHLTGPIAIFFTLLWIDEGNRKKLWQAAIFTGICAAAANAAKLIIPRVRPHSIEDAPMTIATIWDTWGEPWSGSWFQEQMRSFPSGHSALAVGFAIGLSFVYPRGRWIFVVMATAACSQRLVSGAHFLSDILGGVALALTISVCYWRPSTNLDCIPADGPASHPQRLSSPHPITSATE